jgi:peptidoglycan lytic transglycosylase
MRRLVVVAAVMLAACGHPPVVTLPVAPVAKSREELRAAFAGAIQLVNQGRFAEVEPVFRSLLRTYPALEDYHLYYLGLALERLSRVLDAVAPLQRLLADYPQSVQREAAALELGRALSRLGHLSDARGSLRIAAESHDRTIANPASLELARVEIAAGGIFEAADLLQQLRREAPGEEAGRQAKAELQALRVAHPEIAPSGPELMDEIRVLLGERDFAAAEARASSLLVQPAGIEVAELLRLRAQALLGLHRFDDAIAALRSEEQRESGTPQGAATLFRIGSLLWNHDRDQEALIVFRELRRQYPRAAQAPDSLYTIGRIHERAGRFERAIAAYRQLARAAPRARLAREGLWRIAWIHYQNEHWKAAEHGFAALARCRGNDVCVGARYWEARAMGHRGRAVAARDLYRRIVEEAPTSYYAMWAERRLGAAPLATSAVLSPAPANALAPPNPDFHFTRAIELKQAGLPTLARRELTAYQNQHPYNVSELRRLLRWYPEVNGYSNAMRLARRLSDRAGLDHTERQRVIYPLGYWSTIRQATRNAPIDPLLVAALIRQESLFDPDARSPAGAYGLMQLLPKTAARIAGRPVSPQELRDAERNITLGTRYLRQLYAQFHGDVLKALAAYNGGEKSVEKWQRRFAGRAADEFVESISFRETRDYVKKVIGAYRQYRHLYTAASTGSQTVDRTPEA